MKYIIDTDLGGDCDDVGALSLFHNLSRVTGDSLAACTHCSSDLGCAIAVYVINKWYGKEDIPVGIFTKHPFLEEDVYLRYTKKIAEDYLKDNKQPSFEDSVKVLRRTLAENDEVVIITVGMFNNIAELLKSQPDEISELTGVELCEKSVKCMYSMGGHFTDPEYAEYNIALDVESAIYVSENFPKPINYIGFEVGEEPQTGEHFSETEDENPLKTAYALYDGKRSSWDPITVYCAMTDASDLFKRNENVSVTFTKEGKTILKSGGKDCYYSTIAVNAEVEDRINEYLKL